MVLPKQLTQAPKSSSHQSRHDHRSTTNSKNPYGPLSPSKVGGSATAMKRSARRSSASFARQNPSSARSQSRPLAQRVACTFISSTRASFAHPACLERVSLASCVTCTQARHAEEKIGSRFFHAAWRKDFDTRMTGAHQESGHAEAMIVVRFPMPSELSS